MTDTPKPVEINLHQQSRILEISYADGERFELSYEFLRVHSPSAEVQGHGPTTVPTCPNGLLGQYFEAQDFGTLRLTRVDPTVAMRAE